MINTPITSTQVLLTVDPPFELHKHWRLCINTEDHPTWEKKFLQMLVVKYPKLVPMALGLVKSGNFHLPSRSADYLNLEEICFRWKLYQSCKEVPGCVCPPHITRQFK